jgi:hypothetical protein
VKGQSDPIDADKAIIAENLRETIERDRFPMSPRIKSLKAILDKLAPPPPAPIPYPPADRNMALA